MWATEYADSGLGEDYLDPWSYGYAPAAHALYYITNPGPWSTVYAWGWLGSEGEAYLSLPVGNYWIYRFTDNVASGDVIFRTYTMANGFPDYDFDVTGFSVGPTTAWVHTYPSSNSDAIQVAGITGQVLNQHEAVGLGIPAGTYVIHVDAYCEDEGVRYSCYHAGADVTRIYNDPVGGIASPAAWKFLVTHEIGHHVMFRGMGYMHYGYTSDSTVDQCRCDHIDGDWGNAIHCIQSRSITGGAEVEGFGHMFASRVFNSTSASNAAFTYYKPYLNQWDVTEEPPLAFDAFNPHQHMEYWCPQGNHGVELDWLNFFYGISHEGASNPTTVSTLFEIYKLACGDSEANCTNADVVNWNELATAAQTLYTAGSPLFFRFETTGNNTGVNY